MRLTRALAAYTGGLTALLCILCAYGTPSALAGPTGPAFTLNSVAAPTVFNAGNTTGDDRYVLTVTNTGGANTSSPITIEDVLPHGVTAIGEIQGRDIYLAEPPPVECTGTSTIHCTFTGTMTPGDQVRIVIETEVASELEGQGAITNSLSVTGGGAPPASISQATRLGSTPVGFGLAPESLISSLSTLQAGAHPNFTVGFSFMQNTVDNPAGDVRDVGFDMPAGLLGSATAVPQCDMAKVEAGTCPSDTMVGSATTVVARGSSKIAVPITVLVYNITPYPGEPAALAFQVLFPVRLDVGVRSDGEYQIHTSADNLTEASQIAGTTITLWGVPADHNGPGPDQSYQVTIEPASSHSFGGPGGGVRTPFLTNPSLCGAEPTGLLAVDSWENSGSTLPGGFPNLADPAWSRATLGVGRITGCGELSFSALMSVLADNPQAGQPSGYAIDVHVPQNENPDGLATPPLRDITVTLPVGTVLSSASADGLAACSEAQVALHSLSPVECPENSRVASVELTSPLLPAPLQGYLYLAQQGANPFHSLFAAYLVAEGQGVTVKLAGEIQADPTTGQITTTFRNNPQLPASDIKIHLDGGPRAPLANPSTCGGAVSNALLTPYGASLVSLTSSFTVTGCGPASFNPAFTALMTSNAAGSFSPLSVTFSRSDQDQQLSRVQVTMPPGLLAMVSNAVPCAEPQAAQGTCAQASKVGHVTVGVGPGATPLYLPQAGRSEDPVYLTGPYKGAPYGLSIVVHPEAGPITLNKGAPVVVRAAISVDPKTAQVTVTSDPLPQIIEGVPLQVKTVNVTIDREHFTFNPTSCAEEQIAGKFTSALGASAQVQSRFQAADCAKLAFKPGFKVSTSGKTSRVNGASLDAKVTYPAGAQGTQANIAKVKVDLPKQLPSRLTTLQKACPAATFEANPAGCPAASVVGVVKASTPILPVPPPGRGPNLTGPVIFVSHGGEAFPSLEVILQGDGVRVDLAAATFISKAGITSSTFKSVPDVPVSSFELYLPEGKFSALAANGNLCKSKLAMPTEFIAQNGAVIHESTKIAVTGCPRAKAKAKGTKKAKSAKMARGRRGRRS